MSLRAWGVLVIALAALASYFAFHKSLPFRGAGYQLRAVFSANAPEIVPNAPVRIAGVNVGRVVGVSHGAAGTAVATLSISNSGRPVHSDATIALRPRLFLEGNDFLDLHPGSPAAPELRSGGTIPLPQTTTPVQLDQVLSVLDSDVRTQGDTAVRELATGFSGGGGQQLAAGLPEWQATFRDTAIASEALHGTDPGDLARFIAAQARVSGAIAARDTQLADLVSSYARTVAALAAKRADVAATIAQAAPTLQAAPSGLDALDATLPPLRTVAAALRPALQAAPPALDSALPFLSAARKLVAAPSLPALTHNLAPVATTLVPLAPSVTQLLRLVTPVIECVRDHALPVLTSPVDDGALSTGQPAWQELLRMTIGLASAAQNFDANGYYVRYGLGAGENLQGGSNGTGAGPFLAFGSEPLGARPAYTPGHTPPFKPQTACATQPVPSLAAGATAAPAAQPATLTAAARAHLVGRMLAALQHARTPAALARDLGLERLRTPGGAR